MITCRFFITANGDETKSSCYHFDRVADGRGALEDSVAHLTAHGYEVVAETVEADNVLLAHPLTGHVFMLELELAA